MRRSALPGEPVIEDTFVPELEAEETRLTELLRTAEEGAARKVAEAERAAAEAVELAAVDLEAGIAREKERRSASEAERLRTEIDEWRKESERLLAGARRRLPAAVDALIDMIQRERTSP